MLPDAFCGEGPWLQSLNNINSVEHDSGETNISWAAFHASSSHITPPPVSAISRLLPLFRDTAHSIAMIRHSMDIIKKSVYNLNPGQIPVLTVDQPLYAIAKRIQWNWPGSHGEDHFVIVLGGLHIEMAAMKVAGDWLQSSGWTHVLVEAGVTSSGIAESMLHAAHVKRTRHVHEITAATLYLLQQQAYDQYVAALDNETTALDFICWCAECSEKYPQFCYWATTMQLELLILHFVGTIRQSNFAQYIASLSNLIPCFFCHGSYQLCSLGLSPYTRYASTAFIAS